MADDQSSVAYEQLSWDELQIKFPTSCDEYTVFENDLNAIRDAVEIMKNSNNNEFIIRDKKKIIQESLNNLNKGNKFRDFCQRIDLASTNFTNFLNICKEVNVDRISEIYGTTRLHFDTAKEESCPSPKAKGGRKSKRRSNRRKSSRKSKSKKSRKSKKYNKRR
jgi:hypothetical protein